MNFCLTHAIKINMSYPIYSHSWFNFPFFPFSFFNFVLSVFMSLAIYYISWVVYNLFFSSHHLFSHSRICDTLLCTSSILLEGRLRFRPNAMPFSGSVKKSASMFLMGQYATFNTPYFCLTLLRSLLDSLPFSDSNLCSCYVSILLLLVHRHLVQP